MVLLNIIYGFIVALFLTLGKMGWLYTADFDESLFFYGWLLWTSGHIIYDFVAYYVVEYFNRDKVYRG
jgi:hypothetical protein